MAAQLALYTCGHEKVASYPARFFACGPGNEANNKCVCVCGWGGGGGGALPAPSE